MSFLNGDVACANVVAEVDCEIWQIKADTITKMLNASEKGLQAAFYKHLGSYLTSRVRQLTAMVGESIAAKSFDREDGKILIRIFGSERTQPNPTCERRYQPDLTSLRLDQIPIPRATIPPTPPAFNPMCDAPSHPTGASAAR